MRWLLLKDLQILRRSPLLLAGLLVYIVLQRYVVDVRQWVTPADFTVHTALDALGAGDPWAESMPPPQRLPDDLIAHGRTIPVARVAAMHEGKRRARARRAGDPAAPGDDP